MTNTSLMVYNWAQHHHTNSTATEGPGFSFFFPFAHSESHWYPPDTSPAKQKALWLSPLSSHPQHLTLKVIKFSLRDLKFVYPSYIYKIHQEPDAHQVNNPKGSSKFQVYNKDKLYLVERCEEPTSPMQGSKSKRFLSSLWFHQPRCNP